MDRHRADCILRTPRRLETELCWPALDFAEDDSHRCRSVVLREKHLIGLPIAVSVYAKHANFRLACQRDAEGKRSRCNDSG
jgi:hypothetical protein